MFKRISSFLLTSSILYICFLASINIARAELPCEMPLPGFCSNPSTTQCYKPSDCECVGKNTGSLTCPGGPTDGSYGAICGALPTGDPIYTACNAGAGLVCAFTDYPDQCCPFTCQCPSGHTWNGSLCVPSCTGCATLSGASCIADSTLCTNNANPTCTLSGSNGTCGPCVNNNNIPNTSSDCSHMVNKYCKSGTCVACPTTGDATGCPSPRQCSSSNTCCDAATPYWLAPSCRQCTLDSHCPAGHRCSGYICETCDASSACGSCNCGTSQKPNGSGVCEFNNDCCSGECSIASGLDSCSYSDAYCGLPRQCQKSGADIGNCCPADKPYWHINTCVECYSDYVCPSDKPKCNAGVCEVCSMPTPIALRGHCVSCPAESSYNGTTCVCFDTQLVYNQDNNTCSAPYNNTAIDNPAGRLQRIKERFSRTLLFDRKRSTFRTCQEPTPILYNDACVTCPSGSTYNGNTCICETGFYNPANNSCSEVPE